MEKKVVFHSTDGQLEGILYRQSTARGVVISHPHPLFGGDMHNPVVAAMADAYLANGMPEEALVKLEIYGRYDEENPRFWALLGWANHGMEDYDTAFESYEKAYALDSELFETHARSPGTGDPRVCRYAGLCAVIIRS